MKSRFLIFCAALALALAACGDTAENNDDNSGMNNGGSNNGGSNNGGSNNGGSNNGGSNNGGSNNGGGVSFSNEIVPLIADNCANAGCHLDPGNNTSFMVGMAEDAAAVQTAWEGVETAGGRALIEPSSKEDSEVWLRVSGTEGAAMPFGTGPLPPAESDLIGQWIDEGANFDN